MYKGSVNLLRFVKGQFGQVEVKLGAKLVQRFNNMKDANAWVDNGCQPIVIS